VKRKTASSNAWSGVDLIWSGDGRTYLRGVGAEYLLHPFFEEGYEKILKEYKPERHYKVGLFIPCSYGKPYSQSYIHYFILKVLRALGEQYWNVHQVILSNSGVVPRELEEHYPYCCYDWNPKYETPEIKKLYRGFACYLRWDSESYKAIKTLESEIKPRFKIPNLSLPSNSVPLRESELASLGIYNYEEDLILITPSNLRSLKSSLRRLLR